MGFLKFLEKSKGNEFGSKDVPPLPSAADENMHVAELGLPPLPEEKPVKTPELKPIAMPTKEKAPNIIPSLDENTPAATLPEISGPIDEAPEFPSLTDYMKPEEASKGEPSEEVEEIHAKIPPLNIEDSFKKHVVDKPIFLTLENLKSVVGTINQTNLMINDSIDTLLRLIDVKIPLDAEYAKLQKTLEDIQRKIDYADRLFFEEN